METLEELKAKLPAKRVPAEDPEDVRDRDDARIEKYVGEDWAKGRKPSRG